MASNISMNVHLSFEQLIEAIKKLSPNQKALLNEAIWDEMDIPATHQLLVLARMKNAKQNPDRLLDWETVSQSL